ncbi:hypothetical protein PoB_001895100 [Plakobranchus ocellatus]|uniref:Uncharacterized protein n=1 Tax=Plakobranchus ocellatus TaxID=259542 RepID=A0AAV3Z943_9GAST|nr:hypothetical protein PoB_001895100 [Plakobranchus ocellatus]
MGQRTFGRDRRTPGETGDTEKDQDQEPHGPAPSWFLNNSLQKNNLEKCSYDPPKGGENNESTGDSSRNAQKTTRFKQRTMDLPMYLR